MPEFRPQAKVAALLAFFAVTAMLYLGQDFLMPLALAILIAFLLTPCVSKLESWGLRHLPAVITTVLVAFIVAAVSLYVVAAQLVDLANQLPRYKDNLHAKVMAFRGQSAGPLQKASETWKELSKEIAESDPAKTNRVAMPVQVVEPDTSMMAIVRTVSASLLGPLGTSAVVVVFVVFMLIERRDLRDRFIHLVGRGQLRITTQAIDEAAGRVSRYLLAQLIVNTTYGLPIGFGLYFIGIPNAALWGILATVLRFIPYIGPWMAAACPIALSFAISPDWWPPAATIGLFVVIELLSNNVVEPWLYGASTGLSATAIVVSAVFWTWLWGAGGLLLATPLTVCCAVIGKYVPHLSFLDVLLGDHPPIAPEERFYQRLLAGDETELFEMIETYEERGDLGPLFDDLIIPALRHSEQDFSVGVISREDRAELLQLVRQALSSLEGWNASGPVADGDVLIVPARSEGDYLCAQMLSHLLALAGIPARAVSHQMLNSEVSQQLRDTPPRCLCISTLTTTRAGEALLRRLSQHAPSSIILGLWGHPERVSHPTDLPVETARSLQSAVRSLRERAFPVIQQTAA